MSIIKFKIITRGNPRQPELPKKHYATIVRPRNVTLETLAKRISEISPVNELDTLTTLTALSRVIPEFLTAGATVEMGDLGRLQVSISSEGTDTEEDFSKALIKNCKVSFQPSVKVKETLKAAKYEKA
ncbi:HU family DNA-binding protein [Carboxylicivirga taeanensis]|uniref:HU family DNA-binding protein n=1 Tax=Carboxylicivirga taeanensis TaxID=1416875 RepID=UPI003F6E0293